MKQNKITPITFALEQEKKALITYLRASYDAKDVKGKDMFVRLAMDEFEHIRALEAELASLTKEEKWCDYELPVSPIEELVPRLPLPTGGSVKRAKKETEIKAEELGEMSALLVALQLEEEAIKFYRKEKENAQDAISRSLWKRLEEMETAHYELIQAEIDNITRTGFWFGIREFTLEGER